MSQVTVAVELANAQIRAAILDTSEQPVNYPYPRIRIIGEAWPDGIEPANSQSIARIVEMALKIAGEQKKEVKGVGVACASAVDIDGKIRPTYRIDPVAEDFRDPLAYRLEEAFGSQVEVKVGNRSAMGAWGELVYGKPKTANKNTFIFLTGGGVVGAGIVINGKLYRGDQGFAGQFGHMLIDPTRPEQCDLCGRNGCLSSLAGGKAISRNLNARLEKKEPGIEKFVQELGRNRTHPDEDAGQVVKVGSVSIDTRSVMRSATHDDNEIAKQVIGEEAAPLGQAIGQIVGLLDPPLVVLGGIWHDASFLSRKIGEVAQRYLPPFREKNGYAWLVQSILQDKAALLGAAHWVWNGDA